MPIITHYKNLILSATRVLTELGIYYLSILLLLTTALYIGIIIGMNNTGKVGVTLVFLIVIHLKRKDLEYLKHYFNLLKSCIYYLNLGIFRWSILFFHRRKTNRIDHL